MNDIRWYVCRQKHGDATYVVNRPKRKDEKTGKWVSVPGAKYLGKLDEETGEIVRVYGSAGDAPQKIQSVNRSIPEDYFKERLAETLKRGDVGITVSKDKVDVVVMTAMRLLKASVGITPKPLEEGEADYAALVGVGEKTGAEGLKLENESNLARDTYWSYLEQGVFPSQMSHDANRALEAYTLRCETVHLTCRVPAGYSVPLGIAVDTERLTYPPEEKLNSWYQEVAPQNYEHENTKARGIPAVWVKSGERERFRLYTPSKHRPAPRVEEAGRLGRIGAELLVHEAQTVFESYKYEDDSKSITTEKAEAPELLRGISLALLTMWITLDRITRQLRDSFGAMTVSELLHELRCSYRLRYENDKESQAWPPAVEALSSGKLKKKG